jgi:hypothetical protein
MGLGSLLADVVCFIRHAGLLQHGPAWVSVHCWLMLYVLSAMQVSFSMDQHGSRFIQQRLETAPESETALVFAEVQVRLCTMTNDSELCQMFPELYQTFPGFFQLFPE